VKPDPKFAIGCSSSCRSPVSGCTDRLLTSYLNSIRRATQSIYVLTCPAR
jgi:hypothetical protein